MIRLSTLNPVDEPFVDLLVELNWAAGRLVRQYTFLLDPAEYKGPQPIAAAPPKVAATGGEAGRGAEAARSHRRGARRPGPRRRRPPPAPADKPAAPALVSEPAGRHLRGQAGRYARQDRRAVQARRRERAADAGRAVSRERGRVHQQEHEPAPHGARPDDPGPRGGRGRRPAGREQDRQRPVPGLQRLPREARAGRRGGTGAGARRRSSAPPDGSSPRPTTRRRRASPPPATSCGSRRPRPRRARRRRRRRAPTTSPRAIARSAKRTPASATWRRTSRTCRSCWS